MMKIMLQMILLACAAVSVMYGGIILLANSGTSFFLVWFFVAFFFLVCTGAVRYGWLRRLPAWLGMGLTAVVVCGIVLLIVLEILVLSHFHDRADEKQGALSGPKGQVHWHSFPCRFDRLSDRMS